MKIELITKEEYSTLMGIQEARPILTYQAKGYDEIDRTKLTDSDKEAVSIVRDILKKNIYGFSRFQNFKIGKDGDIQIRFQYNYNYDTDDIPFTGVGYIRVNELLNGFDDNKLG